MHHIVLGVGPRTVLRLFAYVHRDVHIVHDSDYDLELVLWRYSVRFSPHLGNVRVLLPDIWRVLRLEIFPFLVVDTLSMTSQLVRNIRDQWVLLQP